MPADPGRLLIVTHVPVTRSGRALYLQGGFGRHVDAFAARFDRVELLTCVTLSDSEPSNYRIRASNVEVTGVHDFTSLTGWRRRVGMARAILGSTLRYPRVQHRASVIHIRLPSPLAPAAMLLSRSTPKPIFFYVGGDWGVALESRSATAFGRLLGRLVHRYWRMLVGRRLCFTAGPALASRFGGAGRRTIAVPTTAIDEEHVAEREDVLSRVRQHPREILFVGAIWEMKGVGILLEAIRQLAQSGLEVRVRFIGAHVDDGSWFDANVAASGLGDRVSHTSFLPWDILMSEYDKSQVFVAPSLGGRGEGIPKVVLEAMARGVPVVASRVGGIEALARHDENAILVNPGEVDEVADAVESLWNQPELRERLALSGLEMARTRTLGAVIDTMVAHIAKSTGRPDADCAA
jgi:glycosyltransferase involved in cell wall biosynthesis